MQLYSLQPVATVGTAGVSGLFSVSYTHLDVYKRQWQSSEVCKDRKMPNMTNFTPAPNTLPSTRDRNGTATASMPVSYTHLVREVNEDPGSLNAICPSGPIPPMNRSIPPYDLSLIHIFFNSKEYFDAENCFNTAVSLHPANFKAVYNREMCIRDSLWTGAGDCRN